MLKKYVVSAFVVAALSGPALAQDTAAASPGTDGGSTFAGPRAEIFGGYEQNQSRFRGTAGVPVTGKRNKGSATAGVELGYDFPIGDRFVAGPLASYSINTTSGSSCVGSTTACLRPQMDWSAGARVGAKMGDKALVYAKGGYVDTQIGTRQLIAGSTIGGHDWWSGWRAGVGAEYAVAPHAYVKAEYNYTQTKSDDVTQ